MLLSLFETVLCVQSNTQNLLRLEFFEPSLPLELLWGGGSQVKQMWASSSCSRDKVTVSSPGRCRHKGRENQRLRHELGSALGKRLFVHACKFKMLTVFRGYERRVVVKAIDQSLRCLKVAGHNIRMICACRWKYHKPSRVRHRQRRWLLHQWGFVGRRMWICANSPPSGIVERNEPCCLQTDSFGKYRCFGGSVLRMAQHQRVPIAKVPDAKQQGKRLSRKEKRSPIT